MSFGLGGSPGWIVMSTSLYRLTITAPLWLVLLHTFGTALYRIFFHPLRNVPGPWLNKVSTVPRALALYMYRQHHYCLELHSRYGPLVRVGPDEIISSDADGWEEIYGFKHGLERAPTFMGTVTSLQGSTGIGLAKGKDHARHKRVIAPLFTRSAVAQQETVIRFHVDKFMDTVRTESMQGGSMTVNRSYAYFTFDIMTHLCFGEAHASLDASTRTAWADAVYNLMLAATWDQSIMMLTGAGTWLSRFLTNFTPAKIIALRRLHFATTQEKVTQVLEDAAEAKDALVHRIAKGTNNKPLLSPVETLLDVSLLMVAGAETTSILLTALTFCLCTCPSSCETLVAELRSSFSKAEQIVLERVISLPYLNAAVREALRIFPPAIVNNQRLVPPGGITVQGLHVAEGMTVGISPWAASRSTANFHAPEEFHPERWLGNDGNAFRSDRLSASKPFGYGPRACVGEALAVAEVKLLMASLLWEFDMSLTSEQPATWSFESGSRLMRSAQTLRGPDVCVRFHRVQR